MKGSEDAAVPGRTERRFERVHGPFDGCRVGKLEVPVRIYDLSLGGCFVNSTTVHRIGTKLVLKIDLPGHGQITVNAEVRNLRPEVGYGVRFLDVEPDAGSRLLRTIDALRK